MKIDENAVHFLGIETFDHDLILVCIHRMNHTTKAEIL